MRSLGFEELMDIAFKLEKKDLETLNEVNSEFNYRVKKELIWEKTNENIFSW